MCTTTTSTSKEELNLAKAWCGKLSHIFDSTSLSLHLNLKLRLYQAAVCSLIMYACETWHLDTKTMRNLNGANITMLSRFTGKSIPQEARPTTTSHDLVRCIRKVRYKYLVNTLRSALRPQSTYLSCGDTEIFIKWGRQHPYGCALTHITTIPHPSCHEQNNMKCRHHRNSIKLLVIIQL